MDHVVTVINNSPHILQGDAAHTNTQQSGPEIWRFQSQSLGVRTSHTQSFATAREPNH